MTESLRLTEILTTSSAVANYLGVQLVQAEHLRLAIDLLVGTTTMDDLGRPQSPLVARMTKAGSGVALEIQELAQRWFARLGGDPSREFSPDELEAFTKEISALELGASSER